MALEISGFSMTYGLSGPISSSEFKIGWCAKDDVMTNKKTTKSNNFISYEEKPVKYENINAGIYVLESKILKYIEKEKYLVGFL